MRETMSCVPVRHPDVRRTRAVLRRTTNVPESIMMIRAA
jgi:hypothetical protein